jgi:hypothetical protein
MHMHMYIHMHMHMQIQFNSTKPGRRALNDAQQEQSAAVQCAQRANTLATSMRMRMHAQIGMHCSPAASFDLEEHCVRVEGAELCERGDAQFGEQRGAVREPHLLRVGAPRAHARARFKH